MSEGEDDAQKTEEPTSKRLEDAQKKGQVVTSREVASFFMLFALALLVLIIAPVIMPAMVEVMSPFITRPHDMAPIEMGQFRNLLTFAMIDIGKLMALPFLLAIVAVFVGARMQHPINFSAESMKPKLSKLSPIAGTKKLFSMKSMVEFLKGIFKIAVIGAVVVLAIIPFKEELRLLPGTHLLEFFPLAYSMALRIFIGVLFVLALIALVDFSYQTYEHKKELRMSLQEIKDEHKQLEGNPEVKQKLRALRQQRSRGRMMASVPEADVIITNPTHFAVALKYDKDSMAAPQVVAKGADHVAAKIRDIARDNNVPLMRNPPLARALYENAEIDEEIPYEYYQAAAEVIGYIFAQKR